MLSYMTVGVYEASAGSSEYRITDFETYALRIDVKPERAIQMTEVDTQPLPMLMAHSNDPEVKAELFWRISWPIAALNLIFNSDSIIFYESSRRPKP